MSEHSMRFANFADGYRDSQMNAELMQRMFGSRVCSRGAGSSCELTPAARAFMKKANTSMAGGRCEGFAVASALFQAGKLKPVDFGGTTVRDLTLDQNVPLQRELAYWFSTQLVPEVSAKKTKSYMAKDVMPALAEALKKDGGERYRIGLVRKRGSTVSGGHALTPISYYADDKAKGVYWLRVYDNNNPDTERLLKIDTLNNRWEFEASENPKRASRLYFGDATNKNPLYLAPIFAREGQLPCFFCEEGGESLVATSGGAEVEGQGVGVRKGEFLGFALPSFTQQLDNGPGEFLIPVPAGALSLKISNSFDPEFPDVTQNVTVQNRNFTVSAFDLTVSAEDQLDVSANGANVRYVNQSRTSLGLRTEVGLPDGSALAVAAILSGSSSDVSAQVDPTTGKVSVAAENSAGSQVTLVVTNTNGSGEEKSAQLTFTSQGDGGISADTAGWMAGGTLAGTVSNNGMEMMVVTNACEDGRKSGMESDVDCGSVCTARCQVGQGCSTGADCASTFCSAANRCVATSCEDGRRSGNETDVDCGGTCGGCGVGKRCANSGDCGGAGVCSAGVCVNSFAVRAAVSGLPSLNAVVLQNNGGDDLRVSSDSTATFVTRTLGAYAVTILTQPTEAQCAVMNGAGTAVADVTVSVICTPTWGVAGTVAGLPNGETVELANGTDAVSVAANGRFTFSKRVSGSYAVTVKTQPLSAVCLVTNGSGTATADVNNVAVTCTQGFVIGGTVSGLPVGRSVMLRNNGADDTVVMADGPFTFRTRATAFSVTVGAQPAGAWCLVAGGVGMATADVTSVVVTCSPSGSLDLSFNTTGWRAQSYVAGSDFWINGTMNNDDSMVLVGQFQNGPGSNWIVSKVLADGRIDSNFGTNGHLTVSTGTAFESARAIFTDSMGRSIVVGTLAGMMNPDFGIARITPNGQLDPLFGTAGTSTHDHGQWEYVQDAASDSMGRFVVIGYTSATGAGPHDTLLARLNPNGTLDTTFGSSGWLRIDAGGDDTGSSVAIDPTTEDIIAIVAHNNDTRLLRFTSTGSPVNSFGTMGVATIDLSGAGRPEWPSRVRIGPGGSIVVAGRADGPIDSDLVVMQFSNTGSPDNAFGTNGRQTFDRVGSDVVYALIAAPGGGWYIGGHSDSNVVVGKLSATGSPVTSFATNGFFESNLANSSLAYHLMLDSAQRIVTVGTIRLAGSEDLGVARLTP
jgi:uncharacterized delta-60 repeat protein